MAFTVEDGTIISGANSYAAVADADTYHTDRGNSAWTGEEDVKKAALIKATDYVTQRYAGRWKGMRSSTAQPLDWPRSGIDEVANNVIPAELQQAVFELALEALSEALNPALDRGGAIKREKVDVLEVEYMDRAPGTKSRPAIDGLLQRYLSGGPLNRKVVRV